jgi:hypothetical protein
VGWIICAVLLTVWDFGVIAFCLSVFLAIWVFGLREKFSNEETGSAYSVFNKDGKAIVGGFTASQFERQMRSGTNLNSTEEDDPIRGDVATAEVTSSNIPSKTSADEQLRRRKAAAAAAERRYLQQQPEEISG